MEQKSHHGIHEESTKLLFVAQPRAGLGSVDGDDARLLGSDGLNTLLYGTLRSAEDSFSEFPGSTARLLRTSFSGCNHFNCLLG